MHKLLNKLPEEIRTILELLLFMIVYFALLGLSGKYPLLSGIVMAGYTGLFLYQFLYKLRYRGIVKFGKPLARLHITNSNDQGRKISEITIGSIVLGASLSLMVFDTGFTGMIFLVMIIGTALFINGLVRIPGSWIEISKNRLKGDQLEKGLDTTTLRYVEIGRDSIVFVLSSGERIYMKGLIMEQNERLGIKSYLARQLKDFRGSIQLKD